MFTQLIATLRKKYYFVKSLQSRSKITVHSSLPQKHQVETQATSVIKNNYIVYIS